MVKWIGGCLVAVIIAIAVASWWGFRAMKEAVNPDGSVSVTIGAPPSRVFASLANADSISTWMAEGSEVIPYSKGVFAAGDSFRIKMRSGPGLPGEQLTWIIEEVVPDRLLAWRMIGGKTKMDVGVRRDSLSVAGDSTTLTSHMVQTANSKQGAALEVLRSLFNVQTKLELMILKDRLEGRPRNTPKSPAP